MSEAYFVYLRVVTYTGSTMSTLAAARADNFYYPPEWTPDQGGLNKFNGQHALRERAKKIDQGILVIRFEMPYHIWCGGCGHMIAQGVRFNAEKKQVGNYYSTKIWSFKMKAPCCGQEIVIQTDPKNTLYVIISGAKEKTVTYDEVDAEAVLLPEKEDRGKLADPFYKLEHEGEDTAKAKKQAPLLVRLQEAADRKHSDSYARNKALRAQLRAQKKRVAAEEVEAQKLGLAIRLLPPSKEDSDYAANVKFASNFGLNQRNKRAAIQATSIFSSETSKHSTNTSRPSPASALRQKLDLLAKRRRVNAAGAKEILCSNVKPLTRGVLERGSLSVRPPVKLKQA